MHFQGTYGYAMPPGQLHTPALVYELLQRCLGVHRCCLSCSTRPVTSSAILACMSTHEARKPAGMHVPDPRKLNLAMQM